MNEDLTTELPEHPSELKQILAIVQDTNQRLSGLEDEVKTSRLEMNQRLSAVEGKVELRAYDTRPLWDRVIGELDRLSVGQEELRNEFRTELTAVRNEFRADLMAVRVEFVRELKKMDRKFDRIFGNQGEMQAQITILEDRMDKIAPEA